VTPASDSRLKVIIVGSRRGCSDPRCSPGRGSLVVAHQPGELRRTARVRLAVILGECVRETFVALRWLASSVGHLRPCHRRSRRQRQRDWAPILASARAGLNGVGSVSVVIGGHDPPARSRSSWASRDGTRSCSGSWPNRRRTIVVDAPFDRLPAQDDPDSARTPPHPPGRRSTVWWSRPSTPPAAPVLRTVDVRARGSSGRSIPPGSCCSGSLPRTIPSATTRRTIPSSRRPASPGRQPARTGRWRPPMLTSFHSLGNPPVIVAVSLARAESSRVVE
jgi:hypothetical protein